jgi:ankyrin repeat protein
MSKAGPLLAAIAAVLLPGIAAAFTTSLAGLIQEGDRKGALALVRAGADVNALQDDGSSPLLWAVYRADGELVDELLRRGADPDRRNVLGASPLAEAVKLGDAALVKRLLEAGADPGQGNEDNQTPLMLAARVGAADVAELLLKAGAKVDAREQLRGQTALMWAAGSGSAEVVALLLRHKADVEARSAVNDWGNQITSEPRAQYRPAGGLTPLLYAVREGCLECTRLLLEAGADIDRPTPEGITPLMTAIDNLHFGLAQYLLDAGANIHLTDWWGRSALYIAVDMRNFGPRFAAGATNQPAEGRAPPELPEPLQLARRLLQMGADPDVQLNMHRPGRGGNQGRFTDDLLTTGATPLLRAALGHDREAVELLLASGAKVDLPNVMGVTPLMAAAGLGLSPRDTRGHYGSDAQDRALAVLPLLLAAGAYINARVADTSSHTAIIARPSSMTNREGQTAIFGAINWSWTRVAQWLIDNGARLDVQDAAGKGVLDALEGRAGGRDYRASDEMKALIKALVATDN